MSRLLLDTNAYVAFKRGLPTVTSLILSAELIVISPVVLAELRAGFEGGSQRDRNIHELEEFLAQPQVTQVAITQSTSIIYASIYQGLRVAGRPIPTNDLWIAACSIEHGLQLLTLDRHFDYVSGLHRSGL